MSDAFSDSEDAIRAGIEWHLRQRPDARDSLRGIAAWWLAPLGIRAMDSLIEAVLEDMASQGALTRVCLPDGTLLYGAPPATAGDRD